MFGNICSLDSEKECDRFWKGQFKFFNKALTKIYIVGKLRNPCLAICSWDVQKEFDWFWKGKYGLNYLNLFLRGKLLTLILNTP